jgi:RNA polymerase sigma-70 factor (ECF subfamily)
MNCILNAWQQYESELKGYLLKRLDNREQVEDLLQDTFLKAVRLGAKFCNLENPRAWLYNVTKNELIDYLRKEKVRTGLSQLTIAELHEISDEPVEQIPVANLSQCLPLALQQLSAQEKQIIISCDFEGLTQAAYAEQHNLKLPAVKSKIQRARKHLKAQLKGQCKIIFDSSGKVCCFTPQSLNKKIK